jgi:hypothetical protein
MAADATFIPGEEESGGQLRAQGALVGAHLAAQVCPFFRLPYNPGKVTTTVTHDCDTP